MPFMREMDSCWKRCLTVVDPQELSIARKGFGRGQVAQVRDRPMTQSIKVAVGDTLSRALHGREEHDEDDGAVGTL